MVSGGWGRGPGGASRGRLPGGGPAPPVEPGGGRGGGGLVPPRPARGGAQALPPFLWGLLPGGLAGRDLPGPARGLLLPLGPGASQGEGALPKGLRPQGAPRGLAPVQAADQGGLRPARLPPRGDHGEGPGAGDRGAMGRGGGLGPGGGGPPGPRPPPLPPRWGVAALGAPSGGRPKALPRAGAPLSRPGELPRGSPGAGGGPRGGGGAGLAGGGLGPAGDAALGGVGAGLPPPLPARRRTSSGRGLASPWASAPWRWTERAGSF